MNSGLWRLFEEEVIEGKYHLRKLLGVGSYGGVFLADEVVADRLIRQVAVKLMETERADLDGQIRELIAATNLDHPSLLRSFTCGLCELNNSPLLYLVTELADGTLEVLCIPDARGSLSVEIHPSTSNKSEVISEVIAAVLSVAQALFYLHGQPNPLVHRDIKPANVMRVGAHWKLGDFGLLRAVDSHGTTHTAAVVGTAAYAPPESYCGDVTTAWDIWSLGVLLVEALSGRLPFVADTPHQMMIAVSSREPVLPSDFPVAILAVVRGCLAKDAAARWTAEQIVDALMQISDPSRTLRPPELHASKSVALSASLITALTVSEAEAATDGDAPPALFVSKKGAGHFRTIADAIHAAPDNATIRVGPGVYREQLIIDRAVRIEGDGDRASIVVEMYGSPCLVVRAPIASVKGVTLVSQVDGQSAVFQASLKRHPAVEITTGVCLLEDCDVACDSTVCVRIHGRDTAPTLRACSIHNGKAGGVSVSGGARASLDACDIHDNGGAGIEVEDGANAVLNKCRIRGSGGPGIRVEHATAYLETCEIVGNQGHGAGLNDGAEVTLRGCSIERGSQAGINARGGCRPTIEDCDIHDNVLSNVISTQGACPSIRRSRIHDGQSNGVWIAENGQGVIEDCDIYGNTFAGVKVSLGANPIFRRCTLRDGKRMGALVRDKATATLVDCVIAANAQAGVYAEPGSRLTMRQCIVRDGLQSGVWIGGDGQMDECEFFGNVGSAVEIHEGGRPTLSGCIIRNGRYLGILARGKAQAIIESCDIEANALAGIAIGEESRVDVRNSRLLNGVQVGIVFWERGRGVVEKCEIRGNALGGVRILSGSDPLLRECRFEGNGYYGVHAAQMAEGAVIRCEFAGGEPLHIEPGCATQVVDNRLQSS